MGPNLTSLKLTGTLGLTSSTQDYNRTHLSCKKMMAPVAMSISRPLQEARQLLTLEPHSKTTHRGPHNRNSTAGTTTDRGIRPSKDSQSHPRPLSHWLRLQKWRSRRSLSQIFRKTEHGRRRTTWRISRYRLASLQPHLWTTSTAVSVQ